MTTLPSLNLSIELVGAGRPNRPGQTIRPTHVTIHNTDNDDPGADAKAHSKFVRNTGFYIDDNGRRHDVSWHFTVDDSRTIQQVPMDELGYHAKSGNGKSLGIEICMHRGIDQQNANDRAALLVAALMKELRIDIQHVVTHKKWTGKICPSKLLNDDQEGARWTAFKTRVADFAAELAKPGAPPLLDAAREQSLSRGSRPMGTETISSQQLENDLDHRAVREQLRRASDSPSG